MSGIPGFFLRSLKSSRFISHWKNGQIHATQDNIHGKYTVSRFNIQVKCTVNRFNIQIMHSS